MNSDTLNRQIDLWIEFLREFMRYEKIYYFSNDLKAFENKEISRTPFLGFVDTQLINYYIGKCSSQLTESILAELKSREIVEETKSKGYITWWRSKKDWADLMKTLVR